MPFDSVYVRPYGFVFLLAHWRLTRSRAGGQPTSFPCAYLVWCDLLPYRVYRRFDRNRPHARALAYMGEIAERVQVARFVAGRVTSFADTKR